MRIDQMGISASINSNPSVVNSSPQNAAINNNDPAENSDDDDNDATPDESMQKNQTRRRSFLLFNEKLLDHSKFFMQNILETKIFVQFILCEHWRGRLNPELKRKIMGQFSPAIWNVGKLNSSAKRISTDETASEYVIHDANQDLLQIFTPLELQSILIACCVACYFDLRCQIDFQSPSVFTTHNDVVRCDTLRYGIRIRSGSEDYDFSNTSASASQSRDEYSDNTQSEEDAGGAEKYNPELLLASFINLANEETLEMLISTGSWISYFMNSLTCLKSSAITIWEVPGVASSKELYTPKLIYSTKRQLHNTLQQQQQQEKEEEVTNASAVTTVAGAFSENTGASQHFLYKPHFQTAIQKQQYYKATVQLLPPATAAADTTASSSLLTSLPQPPSTVSNEQCPTRRYDNLFLQSTNIAMLPCTFPNILHPSSTSLFVSSSSPPSPSPSPSPSCEGSTTFNITTSSKVVTGPPHTTFLSPTLPSLTTEGDGSYQSSQYLLILQHSMNGTKDDRVMIRMTDVLLFAVGLLISIH